jgi:hypothetical protein
MRDSSLDNALTASKHLETNATDASTSISAKQRYRSRKRRRVLSAISDRASRAMVVREATSCAKGPCSIAALNNALLMLDPSSKKLFKVREMIRVIDLLNEASASSPSLKYGHHLQEPGMLPQVFANVRCLCYLVNNMDNQISGDKRLEKCIGKHGRWRNDYWLCRQVSGVFILFGYTGPRRTNGHFVALQADADVILDSLSGLQYNICITSIRTIFPGGFDCAHELLFQDPRKNNSKTPKNNLDSVTI